MSKVEKQHKEFGIGIAWCVRLKQMTRQNALQAICVYCSTMYPNQYRSDAAQDAWDRAYDVAREAMVEMLNKKDSSAPYPLWEQYTR